MPRDRSDGAAGTCRRPETIPELLHIHAEVAG
jgi:hypothetical protein